MEQTFWKKCSTCKREIPFGAKYYQCSVSTCNQGRGAIQFCSSDCWDGHLGFARHRESWAVEATAPSKSAFAAQGGDAYTASRPPVRKIIDPKPQQEAPAAPIAGASGLPKNLETLVVVSKVKQLIKDQSDMNTSQCCIDALTRKVAEAALQAIEQARAVGRKTVMGRDVR
ncbi:MAG: hypothetical protein U0136_14975 [Bdellovibrionota bacterium]